MKRTIIIEILLLCICAILVSSLIPHIQQAHLWFSDIKWELSQGITPHDLAYKYAYTNLIYAIFSFLAIIADLFVISLIAIQNFKFFQPLINKRNERKQARAAAKQARDEEAKQKRIEELQAELNALNNSDESD